MDDLCLALAPGGDSWSPQLPPPPAPPGPSAGTLPCVQAGACSRFVLPPVSGAPGGVSGTPVEELLGGPDLCPERCIHPFPVMGSRPHGSPLPSFLRIGFPPCCFFSFSQWTEDLKSLCRGKRPPRRASCKTPPGSPSQEGRRRRGAQGAKGHLGLHSHSGKTRRGLTDVGEEVTVDQRRSRCSPRLHPQEELEDPSAPRSLPALGHLR